MAHNININNGKASFVSVREIPWHGLGQVVDKAITSKEAIELAGLDFEVTKVALYAQIPGDIDTNTSRGLNQVIKDSKPLMTPKGLDYDTKYYESTLLDDTYAIMRTDNNVILTAPGKTVTKQYTCVQNSEAFEFFDDIVGSKLAMFETAGALGKGGTIFITAKLPKSMYIKGDDRIDNYLLFTSSHDGSGAVKVMFTPIRVVCNNTLNVALNNCKNKLSFKHTANVKDKLSMGKQLLGLADANIEQYQLAFNHLTNIEINSKDYIKAISTIVMNPIELQAFAKNDFDLRGVDELSSKKVNIIKDINKYALIGVGQDTPSTQNNAFGLYNAFTGYFNNIKNYSDEDRFSSIIEGTAQKTTQKVYELCNELENNSIDSILRHLIN